MDWKKLLKEAKARRYSAESAFNTANEKLSKAIESQESDKPIVGDELNAIVASSEAATTLYETASKEVKRLEKAVEKASVPVLPADMPTTPQGEKVPTGDESGFNPQQKAIYVAQFGEPDDALKAISEDIYGKGKNIQLDRYQQRQEFSSYIHGRKNGGNKFANTYIPTEQQMKYALQKGVSVANMKAIITEASDISAGFLVPADIEHEIITRQPGLTVMDGRAKTNDTIRDSKKYIKRTGGDDQFIGNVRVNWVEETPTANANEQDITYSEETISVHTAMATSRVSKNLVDDTAYDISSELSQEWGTAVQITKDNVYIAGNGVGKPQGILIGEDGLTVAEGVFVKETAGVGVLDFDSLVVLARSGIATQYRQGSRPVPGTLSMVGNQMVIGQGLETQAGWIASRATYAAIAELKDLDGQYLWKEFRGNNAVGTPLTLNGFSVWEQEVMPAIAAGVHPLLFGNPGGYEILNRLGMAIQVYDVNPGENIVIYELKFRTGGQVSRPWMLSALKIKA